MADHWAEQPGHPVSDWKQEVADDTTRLSYAEWVQSRTRNDIVARINAGEVVTASFGTAGVKIQDSQPRSGKVETNAERYARLSGGDPPYGSAGGSASDHMERLRRTIAAGHGGDIYDAETLRHIEVH